jgi:hypothetical protein
LADGQESRQKDRQAGGQAGRQTGRQTDRQTDLQKDRVEKGRCMYYKIHVQTYKYNTNTDRQIQRDSQTATKKAVRHTDTKTEIQTDRRMDS